MNTIHVNNTKGKISTSLTTSRFNLLNGFSTSSFTFSTFYLGPSELSVRRIDKQSINFLSCFLLYLSIVIFIMYLVQLGSYTTPSQCSWVIDLPPSRQMGPFLLCQVRSYWRHLTSCSYKHFNVQILMSPFFGSSLCKSLRSFIE